jgi:hypothetical protein
MRQLKRLITFLICLSITLLISAVPAFSAPPTQTDCTNLKVYVENLTDVTFDKPVTNITATWNPAVGSTPEHCQVTGWIWPEIQFAISLPPDWNERYINNGGGGWDGNLGSYFISTSSK